MLMMVLPLWMQPNERVHIVFFFSPCMRACGLRGAYSGTIHYIGTIHCATHYLRDSGVSGRYSGKSTVPDFRANLPVLSYRYCLLVCLFVCCTGTVQVPYYRYRTGTVQVGECVSGVPPGREGPL